LNPRPLGYEPYDMRVSRLKKSPVTEQVSEDPRLEVVPELPRLLRFGLSHRVSCTNPCTNLVPGLPVACLSACCLLAAGGISSTLGSGRLWNPGARGAWHLDAAVLAIATGPARNLRIKRQARSASKPSEILRCLADQRLRVRGDRRLSDGVHRRCRSRCCSSPMWAGDLDGSGGRGQEGARSTLDSSRLP
jgi:hypothetical protein